MIASKGPGVLLERWRPDPSVAIHGPIQPVQALSERMSSKSKRNSSKPEAGPEKSAAPTSSASANPAQASSPSTQASQAAGDSKAAVTNASAKAAEAKPASGSAGTSSGEAKSTSIEAIQLSDPSNSTDAVKTADSAKDSAVLKDVVVAKDSAEPKATAEPATHGSAESKAPAAEGSTTYTDNSSPDAESAATDPAASAVDVEHAEASEASDTPHAAQYAANHDWFDRAYSYSGLACLAAGLLVAVLVFSGYADNLDALGNPKLVAGALAIFGALLFGMGRVRRILRGVERTVATVRKQTDRLDEVVRDGNELRHDVVEVSGAAAGLRADVAAVQSYLEDLTRIVANPEIQVSMFHLAASQDKIAKRLDLALNERFKTLHTEFGKMVEAVARAQRELTGSVELLEQHAAEQFGSQTARLERALEPVLAAASEQSARIERLQERLKDSSQELMLGHETVAEGLARASEASERNARAAAASFDKHREQFESRLQTHAKALDARVERVCADLEQRLGRVESEQARCLREVADALRAELGESTKSLRESVDAVGGALAREHAGFATDLQALAPRFEQRMSRIESEQARGLRELAKALKSELEAHARTLGEGLDAATETLGRTQEGIASEVQALAPRLEQRLRDEAGSLLADLHSLAQAGQAAVKEGLGELRANTQAAQRELAAGIARVAPQIEARVGEQADRLAAEVREGARSARQDLNEVREELESALQSGWSSLEEQAKRSSQGLTNEATRISSKLDELSGAQAALVRESLQAASHVASELTSFGQHLVQGIERIDDAQSAMLSEISGRLAADRMRGERTLQECMRSLETAALRHQQELTHSLGELAPAVAAEVRADLGEVQAQLERARAAADSSASHLRGELQTLGSRIEALQSAETPLLEGSVLGQAESDEPTVVEFANEVVQNGYEPVPNAADRPEPLRIDPAVEPPSALPRVPGMRSPDARASDATVFGAWIESPSHGERPTPPYGAPGSQRRDGTDVDPEC
jgi:hypothetical protein